MNLDWKNNFNNSLTYVLNEYGKNLEEKIKQKIINNLFYDIKSNGDKFKYIKKMSSNDSQGKSKYFYKKLVELMKDYEDYFYSISTKLEDLNTNELYSRLEISIFSNCYDLVSGVLVDQSSKNVFITVNLKEPYKYHFSDNNYQGPPLEVSNEMSADKSKIKYYAYTTSLRSTDFATLNESKNFAILNATGNTSGYIFAFSKEATNKYKYLGQYINTNLSATSPYFFELEIYNHISASRRNECLQDLYIKDLNIFSNALNKSPFIKKEDKKYLIKVRCNQGIFRERLILKYNHECPLTVLRNENVLIASHIKPYSNCKTMEEKIDVENGILLSSLADGFFDKGLMTFSNEGEIIFSNKLLAEDKKIFINHLKKENIHLELSQKMLKNMEHHRKNVFLI